MSPTGSWTPTMTATASSSARAISSPARNPFEKLKTGLKAEVDEATWSTLYATESRPFPAPRSGRIAVKVINHYGDQAMRVFGVG
jgi:hypothetical protein